MSLSVDSPPRILPSPQEVPTGNPSVGTPSYFAHPGYTFATSPYQRSSYGSNKSVLSPVASATGSVDYQPSSLSFGETMAPPVTNMSMAGMHTDFYRAIQQRHACAPLSTPSSPQNTCNRGQSEINELNRPCAAPAALPNPVALSPSSLVMRRKHMQQQFPQSSKCSPPDRPAMSSPRRFGSPKLSKACSSILIYPFTPEALPSLLDDGSNTPVGPVLVGSNTESGVVPNSIRRPSKKPLLYTSPVLTIDLRSATRFQQAHVRGAVNLGACLSPSSLEDDSLTFEKAVENFLDCTKTSAKEKEVLRRWDSYANIIIVDDDSPISHSSPATSKTESSIDPSEPTVPTNMLAPRTLAVVGLLQADGYTGCVGILKGGVEAMLFDLTAVGDAIVFCGMEGKRRDSATGPVASIASKSHSLPSVQTTAPSTPVPRSSTAGASPLLRSRRKPHLTLPKDMLGAFGSGASDANSTSNTISHQTAPTFLRENGPASGTQSTTGATFSNAAFNPFFSTIRQNMELCHGGITDRIPVRLPAQHRQSMEASLESLPRWLQLVLPKQYIPYLANLTDVISAEPRLSAMYESVERAEQERLQNLMSYLSRNIVDATPGRRALDAGTREHNQMKTMQHPLSITAAIEKGTLNRYSSIWPFEFRRVKLGRRWSDEEEGELEPCANSVSSSGSSISGDAPLSASDSGADYINASFVRFEPRLHIPAFDDTPHNRPTDQFLQPPSTSNSEAKQRAHSLPLPSLTADTPIAVYTDDTVMASPGVFNDGPESEDSMSMENHSESDNTDDGAIAAERGPMIRASSSITHAMEPYRTYIATQGPLPTTFADFWRVIWEQGSRVIVMLTREEEMHKIKCHRYWPASTSKPETYGNFRVELLHERYLPIEHQSNGHQAGSRARSNPFDDALIIREFRISKSAHSMTLTQIQYTGWLDFDVPENPFGLLRTLEEADVAYTRYAQQMQSGERSYPFTSFGPMVVHCSAGCGRTGSFCTIDTILQRVKRGEDLDTLLEYSNSPKPHDALLQTVENFRQQRVSMVQTLRQFVFCYEAIIWYLLRRKIPVSTHEDVVMNSM